MKNTWLVSSKKNGGWRPMRIIGYVDRQNERFGNWSHIVFTLGYTHWIMDIHGRNKALISNKDMVHCLMVCILYNPQSKYCSLTNHTMKQQQEVLGTEFELVQAKMAVERSVKGKRVQCMFPQCKCTYTSVIRIPKASSRLYYIGFTSRMSLIVSLCIA